MDCSERDRFHIVAIVRALRDARRFMGDLSFEAFAESDEKQNAVAMAIARCSEHVKRLSKEFRDAESGVERRGRTALRCAVCELSFQARRNAKCPARAGHFCWRLNLRG